MSYAPLPNQEEVYSVPPPQAEQQYYVVDKLPAGAVPLQNMPQAQPHYYTPELATPPQPSPPPAPAADDNASTTSPYVEPVAPLVLGILSCVVFWPLCFVGLILARRNMRKIDGNIRHTAYHLTRVALILNTVSLIVGSVMLVVSIIILAVEYHYYMQAVQNGYGNGYHKLLQPIHMMQPVKQLALR